MTKKPVNPLKMIGTEGAEAAEGEKRLRVPKRVQGVKLKINYLLQKREIDQVGGPVTLYAGAGEKNTLSSNQLARVSTTRIEFVTHKTPSPGVTRGPLNSLCLGGKQKKKITKRDQC